MAFFADLNHPMGMGKSEKAYKKLVHSFVKAFLAELFNWVINRITNILQMARDRRDLVKNMIPFDLYLVKIIRPPMNFMIQGKWII